MTRNVLAIVLAAAWVAAAESPGRLWVRLQDDSGQPVAARVYLTDGEGRSHAPDGSIARQHSRSRAGYFHADGQFQMTFPAGRALVEAVKGFEYRPAKGQATVAPDRTTVLTLTLKRAYDLPAEGWHSGDVHMHPNHVLGGLYIGMDDVLLLAKGEDIHVSNLLIGSVGVLPHVFDTEHFSLGEPDPLSTPDYLLVAQQEVRNVSAMYGHIALLGIRRFADFFFSGQERSEHWEDYPPNYAAARQGKAQGAAVVYLHPAARPEPPVGDHLARELVVDAALGVVDAMDVLSNMDEEAGCWMYYRMLNCGVKLTASAGTDSQIDQARHALPGGSKVYVKTGAPLTYSKWLAAFKAGRTFVSNGPLVWLEVDGKEPGEEIALPAARSVKVVAKARSLVPMSGLELVMNGEVVARAEAAGGGTEAEIRRVLPVARSGWIAARVWGPPHRLVVNDAKAFAHTSPVYCTVAGQKIAMPADARIALAWIDKLLADVAASPRFESGERKAEVAALFRKARRYYEDIAAAGGPSTSR